MNRQKLTKSIDVTKQKRASDYVNQDRFRKNRSAEFVAMTRGREWVKISPKQGSDLVDRCLTFGLISQHLSQAEWLHKYEDCPQLAYLLFWQACLLLPLPPNLIISLQAEHLPQSDAWHTWKKIYDAGSGSRGHCRFSLVSIKGHFWTTYLTDTTTLSLHTTSILIVLVNLIGEKGVKDLIDQFSGGGFSWALVVLFNLGGMTDGLSSGCSPEEQKCNEQQIHHFRYRNHYQQSKNGVMHEICMMSQDTERIDSLSRLGDAYFSVQSQF